MTTWITFPDGGRGSVPDERTPPNLDAWFQTRLKAYHGHKPRPTCNCRRTCRSLGISIRAVKSGRFTVARMPLEGPLHAEECSFHAPDIDRTGLAGYVEGVAEETDGEIRVRLNVSLTIKDPDPQSETTPFATPRRPGAARQRAMTNLGLLHYLWQEAGLNTWHRGFRDKRHPRPVAKRLTGTSDQFTVVKTGLETLFIAVAAGLPGVGAGIAELTRDKGKSRRLVVVGEVIGLEETTIGATGVHLAGERNAKLYLSMSNEQAATVQRRFPYAKRMLQVEDRSVTGARVFGLFVIQVTPAQWPNGLG